MVERQRVSGAGHWWRDPRRVSIYLAAGIMAFQGVYALLMLTLVPILVGVATLGVGAGVAMLERWAARLALVLEAVFILYNLVGIGANPARALVHLGLDILVIGLLVLPQLGFDGRPRK